MKVAARRRAKVRCHNKQANYGTVCCIYHKQRAFDESSSESSVEESEDDEESELEISESDSDTNDDGNVERAHGSGEDRLHRASNRKGGHKHGPGCAGHSPRPNAYERA